MRTRSRREKGGSYLPDTCTAEAKGRSILQAELDASAPPCDTVRCSDCGPPGMRGSSRFIVLWCTTLPSGKSSVLRTSTRT
eukprot:3428902-Rhodomonas_salina.1